MKILKLLSTKAKRKKDYDAEMYYNKHFVCNIIGMSIYLLFLGIIWVQVKTYSFECSK